jgi:hypothetical protein
MAVRLMVAEVQVHVCLYAGSVPEPPIGALVSAWAGGAGHPEE